jgi:hypothetical protein
MKAKTAAIASLLGATAVGVVALFILAILVRGFCLSVLWGWLIVPVFGLPALGIAPAIGLTVFLNYLLNHKKEESSLGDVLLGPMLALGVGWVIHLFI